MKKYDRRIVVVTRETRLEKVLASQNTRGQAKFYVNSLGGDFDDYDREDRQYHASVREAQQGMEALGNLQMLDRKYLPNFIFAPDDLIVVIGQDGLVANTLKYLDGQPVVGINPDPARWDGVLLPFTPKDAAKIVEDSFRGRRKTEEVSMARARIQNGQELLAVNDFFIGQRTHVSARYVIKHGDRTEPQSSSGIIVSTGLGSTGWMKSVIAGASRISSSLAVRPHDGRQEGQFPFDATPVSESGRKRTKKELKKKAPQKNHRSPEPSGLIGHWKSKELVFAVREPFPSNTTGATLVFGKISPNETLRIESLMGENGVIFSDGMESDFLVFNSGVEAVITLADKRGYLVM